MNVPHNVHKFGYKNWNHIKISEQGHQQLLQWHQNLNSPIYQKKILNSPATNGKGQAQSQSP